MPITIQIVLVILVLLLPVVFFLNYLNSIEKKSKQIIISNSISSSELHQDLKVWIKNFNILKKKNKFDLDAYQTNYFFNDCDLILNDVNFVVIGKTNFFGKKRYLTPTIFEYDNNKSNQHSRQVICESIREVGQDLEIEFSDNQYPNKMTFVIKCIDNELKEKIKTGFNKVHIAGRV